MYNVTGLCNRAILKLLFMKKDGYKEKPNREDKQERKTKKKIWLTTEGLTV